MGRKPNLDPEGEGSPAEEPVPTAAAATSCERAWAAASHAGIILFPFAVVPSLLIWIFGGRSSKFINHQSGQAFLAQVALDVLTAVLIGIAIMLRGIPLVGPLFFGILWIILVVLWIAAFLYGIYGAVKVSRGEEFSYPVISDFVRS